MPSVEHAYRYPFPSELVDGAQGRRLRLATSGGAEPGPYFFRGRLASPRRTAQLLLGVSEIAARRFFLPAATIVRVLRDADPVVTAGGERLRFESFSRCCGVYARCDLRREAVDGDWTGRGTTNVDFNAPMRAALARVMDHDRVGLHVGADAVELERETGSVVERRVKLPLRWVKGFVEVQCYQASMRPAVELSVADAARLLDSLPREVPYSGPPAFLVPFGRTFRLSQRSAPGAIAVGGPSRLRVLRPLLLPGARAVRVWRHDAGTSGWEIVFDDASFHLVLSPDAARGFSGEGQVLLQLATAGKGDAPARVRAALRWQARLSPEELAREAGLGPAEVSEALAVLGARGLVGFDLADGAWFHRELPFDLEAVEALQPRLADARAIVAAGGVRIASHDGERAEAWVRGTDVEHRVRLEGEDERCTCPWMVRNEGARGPCKHVLAARIVLGDAE